MALPAARVVGDAVPDPPDCDKATAPQTTSTRTTAAAARTCQRGRRAPAGDRAGGVEEADVAGCGTGASAAEKRAASSAGSCWVAFDSSAGGAAGAVGAAATTSGLTGATTVASGSTGDATVASGVTLASGRIGGAATVASGSVAGADDSGAPAGA